MIIAMLLGPISGVALGLVDKDNALLQKALGTLAGGVAVVYATALVLGTVHREIPLTAEIYARTAPNLMDVMIAIGGGAAGAFAMISPRLSVAFVGVAIATALVPPLASHVSELKRNLLSVVLLGALVVFLAIQLRRVIGAEVYEAIVRTALHAAATDHAGAYLTDLRVQKTGDRALVVAVFRTPTPFTPADVAALESRIPTMPGATVELRIRSVPITVASRSGYVFSTDLTDHDRPQ